MKRIIFPLMLVLGFFLILFSFLLVYNQISEVKEFCAAINGTYEFKGVHLCDGELVYKYSFNGNSYWGTSLPFSNMSFNYSKMEFEINLYKSN